MSALLLCLPASFLAQKFCTAQYDLHGPTLSLTALEPHPLSKALLATALGAIPLGSSTAFLDLTGSFIILSTVSYAIPFMANVLTGRKYFPKGPFNLGSLGTPINLIAVLFIVFFDILYCFRK